MEDSRKFWGYILNRDCNTQSLVLVERLDSYFSDNCFISVNQDNLDVVYFPPSLFVDLELNDKKSIGKLVKNSNSKFVEVSELPLRSKSYVGTDFYEEDESHYSTESGIFNLPYFTRVYQRSIQSDDLGWSEITFFNRVGYILNSKNIIKASMCRDICRRVLDWDLCDSREYLSSTLDSLRKMINDHANGF